MHLSALSTFVFSWMILVMESNTHPVFDDCWGDMIFVMDASSSIWVVDFRRQLDFVANLAETFDIGPGPKQVGIGAITFSDRAFLDFPLDRYQNLPDLKVAIRNIPYRTGGTNTAEALELLRNNLTPYVNLKKRPLIAVVITDGLSWDSEKTKKEAKEIHRLGINMQAVGVGYNYDMGELKAIASDPVQGVHVVTSYAALSGIADKFRAHLCQVIHEQSTSSPKPPTTTSSKIPVPPNTGRIEETNPLVSRKETSKSERVEKESVHQGKDAAGGSVTISPKFTLITTRNRIGESNPRSNSTEIRNKIFPVTKATPTMSSKGSITDTSGNPINPIPSRSEDRENKQVPPRNIPGGVSPVTPTGKDAAENPQISNSAEKQGGVYTGTKPTSWGSANGSRAGQSHMSMTPVPSKSKDRENKLHISGIIPATGIETAENVPVPNKGEIPNGILTTIKPSKLAVTNKYGEKIIPSEQRVTNKYGEVRPPSEETVVHKGGAKITPSSYNSASNGHESGSQGGIAAGVTASVNSKFTKIPTKEQIGEKTPISNRAEIPNALVTTTDGPYSNARKGSIIDESWMRRTSIPPHSEDRRNKLDPEGNIPAGPSEGSSSKNTMESHRRPMPGEIPGKSEIPNGILTTTKATSLTAGQEASGHKSQMTPMTPKTGLRENEVPDKSNGVSTSREAGRITTVEESGVDKPQTGDRPITSKERQRGPTTPVNKAVGKVTDLPQMDYASTVVFGFDLKSMGSSRSNSILHFINYILPYIGYGKFALISNALCTQNFNIPLTLASDEDIAKHMKISLLRKLNQKKPPVLVDILKQMKEELYKDSYHQNGQKKRKIGVLFVDPSVSEVNPEVLLVADEMKARGLELYVISLGSSGWSDVKMFSGLSSQPYRNFLFAVPRYESLPQLVRYLPLQFRGGLYK